MVSKSTSKPPLPDGQVKRQSEKRQSKRGSEKRGSVSSDGMTDQLTKSVEASSSSDVSDHHEESPTSGRGKESLTSGQKESPTNRQEKESGQSGLRSAVSEESESPFTLRIQIHMIPWSLFFLALALRVWRLDSPRSVVFDELHYGRFISMYIRGIFFFDSQPPLGKQLISLVAYLGMLLSC